VCGHPHAMQLHVLSKIDFTAYLQLHLHISIGNILPFYLERAPPDNKAVSKLDRFGVRLNH
jgi:hypothetical protein